MTEVEALKKAVAKAEEKAAAEKALREKYEARVIKAEQELQEAEVCPIPPVSRRHSTKSPSGSPSHQPATTETSNSIDPSTQPRVLLLLCTPPSPVVPRRIGLAGDQRRSTPSPTPETSRSIVLSSPLPSPLPVLLHLASSSGNRRCRRRPRDKHRCPSPPPVVPLLSSSHLPVSLSLLKQERHGSRSPSSSAPGPPRRTSPEFLHDASNSSSRCTLSPANPADEPPPSSRLPTAPVAPAAQVPTSSCALASP
nr:vegetative cell wall protein gp1-like [Aegilops tauschii subsp. strangulata]